MAEMLHELVSKRESKERLSSGRFEEMLARAQIAYQQVYSQDTRAQQSIDIVLRQRPEPAIGSTIQMPHAVFANEVMIYTYTGDAIGTYRGWVRTN